MTLNPTYINSEVMCRKDADGKGIVEIVLSSNAGTISVKTDRATGARLINQLRRAMDQEHNDAINNRENPCNELGSQGFYAPTGKDVGPERPLSDPHPEPPSYPIPNY